MNLLKKASLPLGASRSRSLPWGPSLLLTPNDSFLPVSSTLAFMLLELPTVSVSDIWTPMTYLIFVKQTVLLKSLRLISVSFSTTRPNLQSHQPAGKVTNRPPLESVLKSETGAAFFPAPSTSPTFSSPTLPGVFSTWKTRVLSENLDLLSHWQAGGFFKAWCACFLWACSSGGWLYGSLAGSLRCGMAAESWGRGFPEERVTCLFIC